MDLKAFDFALLKVKRELTAFELYIAEKNNERLNILSILEKQEEAQKSIESKINEAGFIAPSFIFFNRQFDHKDRELLLKRLKTVEKELFAIKKEYLSIKEKENKIIELKLLKEKEIKNIITLKEDKLAFNDFVSKKAMIRRYTDEL